MKILGFVIVVLSITAFRVATANPLLTTPCDAPNFIGNCRETPEALQFRVFLIGLCETLPPTPTTTAPIDYSGCFAIYDKIGQQGQWVDFDGGVGDAKQFAGDLTVPPNGTYPYVVVAFGDEWRVKKKMTFNVPLYGWDGSQGTTCATRSNGDDYLTQCSNNVDLESELTTMDISRMVSQTSFEYPDGLTSLHLMTSELKLATVPGESGWMAVHRTNQTPITINDSTRGIRLKFPLSNALLIDHDNNILPGLDIYRPLISWFSIDIATE